MSDRTGLLLASTVDFAVIHTSVAGVIEAWSGAAERVLGFAADEAIGSSLSRFFTPEDIRLGLDSHEIAVALSQGRSEDDRWHVRKDGSRFWASGVLTLLKSPDGEPVGLCKVLRDKTDVRTQIQMLENQVAALKAELDAQRGTINTLAHEMRNPLMPILSALALLQRPDASGEITQKAGRILTNQAGVLKRLVNDLSAVGAGPDAGLALVLETVNLNATLSETVDGLRDAALAKRQQLSLVLPPADIEIAADPARLQQMLLNLLNNALKYTPAGGHVDVSVTVEAEMAVVRVEDDGVGIAPDVLPRIFELFTREGRQPEVDGQGVGLAIVKRLATAHGGMVEARSPGHDKGAIFSLRIPLGSGMPVATTP